MDGITMRNYVGTPLHGRDYKRVRTFLRDCNRDRLVYPGFSWGRWEWMITHAALDRSALSRIGLWEERVSGESPSSRAVSEGAPAQDGAGRIVALATYESTLGDAYLFLAPEMHATPGGDALLGEMLAYAREALAGPDGVRVIIDNNDRAMQRVAARMGFIATGDQETTAILDITGGLDPRLPEGYTIVSMADDWDWAKYETVMHRGFDHEGPPDLSPEAIRVAKEMHSSGTIHPALVLAVQAPDGRYVSHCGMWYAPGDTYALVEPVATDPDFRRMGLGRAAVLEACIRCGRMGAKVALVGSSQAFYYRIGFAPMHTGSWWVDGERG